METVSLDLQYVEKSYLTFHNESLLRDTETESKFLLPFSTNHYFYNFLHSWQ